MPVQSPTSVYVGTYTLHYSHVDGEGNGIPVFTLDPKDGAITRVSVTRGIVDPAYLALSPDRTHLYAVGETPTSDGAQSFQGRW